jgi:cephalosporin hydroxylase
MIENFSWFTNTDLGENSLKLHEIAQTFKNSTFVDLGVRQGSSSGLLCDKSTEYNNQIYGIDLDFTLLNKTFIDGENYVMIEGDSSTIGKRWDKGGVDLLFVDTLHVKEQVLSELYFWIDHMNTNSYIVFHDSHWPEKMAENIGGKQWDRVDDAIIEFFNLKKLENKNTPYITVECYPESWGMTFVKIKKKINFKKNIENWSEVFQKRNELISNYWNTSNVGNKIIELELKND